MLWALRVACAQVYPRPRRLDHWSSIFTPDGPRRRDWWRPSWLLGEGNFDLGVIDSRLGQDFDISMIMYKAYACAGGIHPALTAVEELRTEAGFFAGDVDEVLVYTSQHVVESFALPREVKCRPRTGAQAQFSLPYSIGALLVDGVALMEQFSEDAISRADILEVAERVNARIGDELVAEHPDAEPCRVVVRLKDGTVLDKTVPGGKGSLVVPMHEAELRAKFHTLADPLVGRDRASAIEERVLSLRSDKGVGDLPSWLALSNPKHRSL
jgi:2-methylcitrate dehydratase PrpD